MMNPGRQFDSWKAAAEGRMIGRPANCLTSRPPRL